MLNFIFASIFNIIFGNTHILSENTMKNNSLLFAILTIALTSSISLHAQSLSTHHPANSSARSLGNGDGSAHYAGPVSTTEASGAPMQALSNGVSIVGADSMPVWGHFQQQQSDGRGLHNIQVDPSNPLNVHAVIMEELSTNPKDTNFFSRRLLYTFSSDGGHTWKTPDTLGNPTRTGFACMVLYKHNGAYVPIIAGHQYLTNSPTSAIQSAIWIEQGAPGAGNFAMTGCGTAGVNGEADLLWPNIGVSPSGNTVYIVSSFDNPSSATAVDYMEFGTFSIDESGTATFNGWSQLIGSNNTNDADAGFAAEGDYVLRVSSSGKVGLLWREADYSNFNTSLYFIESTDGGKTWPASFSPLEVVADQGTTDPSGNDVYSGPWTGLDFFYSGENAKIVWSADDEAFDNTGNTYYPTEASLHFYDVATGHDDEFVSNRSAGDDTSQYSLLGSLPSFNNTVDSESDPFIAYPTIAQSSNPNTFAVFYQTFPLADTVVISESGGVKFYGSIYYQLTQDGGLTWTAPTPFRTNNGPAGSFGKIDFRWPSSSDWNGSSLAVFSPTVMYGADTAAGTTAKAGDPDWDVVTFFHDTLAAASLLGVSSNGSVTPGVTVENYPNPFTASTTIDFTLPAESNVLLTVTDMLGRPVATLVNGRLVMGEHTAVFNANNLADGVYRYILQANGASISGSLSLVR